MSKFKIINEIISRYNLYAEKIIFVKLGEGWVVTDLLKIHQLDEAYEKKLNKYFTDLVVIDIAPNGSMEVHDCSGELKKEWLTPEEAAEYLNISLSYLNQLVREGKVRTYSPEKKIRRFRIEDLDAFIKGDRKKKRGRKPSLEFPL